MRQTAAGELAHRAATEGARMQAQSALATARDEDEITAIEAAFNEALSGLSI